MTNQTCTHSVEEEDIQAEQGCYSCLKKVLNKRLTVRTEAFNALDVKRMAQIMELEREVTKWHTLAMDGRKTPMSDMLEKTRVDLQQTRTAAYGDALALCRKLEEIIRAQSELYTRNENVGQRAERLEREMNSHNKERAALLEAVNTLEEYAALKANECGTKYCAEATLKRIRQILAAEGTIFSGDATAEAIYRTFWKNSTTGKI